MSEFWLTPKDLLRSLDNEFHFDFDPCPYPRLDGYNSLVLPWGKMNYVNPPFNRKDGPFGGPTAFVRKAVEEHKKGNRSVIILPVSPYIEPLIGSGAEIRAVGRVKFLDGPTGESWKNPRPCAIFILK